MGTSRGSGIQCLTIVGQIEGHQLQPDDVKTTKYEHVLPQLAQIEDSCEVDGLLILIHTVGGDVYRMKNSTIEYSDDNWYYNRTPDESYYDYVQNSCNKSESYIRTFKNHFCDRPLFSFALENEI